MTTVELRDVTVVKDGHRLVHDIDLELAPGSVTALLGPSGSGKTTILRTLAGLDAVAAGAVTFDGHDVTVAPPHERDVSFVFQMPVLLTTRSARRNISFPLELRRRSLDEIRKRVAAEARALQIEALLERRPSTLSVGEAQVVQIARAIVRRPRVLLLDEPFSQLDGSHADQLRRELTLVQRGFGVTTLLATNESVEAMTMADRVAIVDGGRITQIGEPLDVFDRPRTVLAALLTGEADVVNVDVTGDADGSWLVADGLRIRAWQPALDAHRGRRLQLVVRPTWWELHGSGVPARVERIAGTVTMPRVMCRIGGRVLAVQLFERLGACVTVGAEVGLRLRRYVLVDPRDGYRLDVG